MAPGSLTARAVAAMERRYPGLDDGRKSAAVRAELGVSMTAYTQRLNQLLGDPAFLELAPVHARMLRARRAASSRHRRWPGDTA